MSTKYKLQQRLPWRLVSWWQWQNGCVRLKRWCLGVEICFFEKRLQLVDSNFTKLGIIGNYMAILIPFSGVLRYFIYLCQNTTDECARLDKNLWKVKILGKYYPWKPRKGNLFKQRHDYFVVLRSVFLNEIMNKNESFVVTENANGSLRRKKTTLRIFF